MKITDTLNKVLANPMTNDISYKYRNNIDLSGFILKKPHIIKHDKTGIESCAFILYQVNAKGGDLKIESFNCITYVRELVDQFKTLNNVIFVATVGKLRYSPRIKGDYTQVVEIATLFEYDIELTID